MCTHQLEEVSRQSETIGNSNAAVLAVSVDDAIVHSQTSLKIENKFPLLLDPDAKAIRSFGVYHPEEKMARPSLFLIGPDGKVLYHYVGKQMHDRPETSTVVEMVKHYSGALPKSPVRGK